MLDIEAELDKAHERFVSLGELADTVYSLSTNTTYSGVANWLLMKIKQFHTDSVLPPLSEFNIFCEITAVNPCDGWEQDIHDIAKHLSQVRENNCLPFTHPPEGQEGNYWISEDLERTGFEREKIADCFGGHLRSFLLAEVILEDIPIDNKDPVQIDRLEFRGRDALLEIIAGQAITIGKISGKHNRATGVNKSALARDIMDAISDYGNGMSVDEKQVRSIIAEAIALKAGEITCSEQVINLAAEQAWAVAQNKKAGKDSI